MLTTEDIQKLTSILATKEDIKEVRSDSLSLKSDVKELKNYTEREVTSLKTDIKELRTYTEQEIGSVKEDIKELRNYTEREVTSLKSDIREIKEDVAGLRESLQGMIVAVDNLTKVISDLRMEYTAITYQLKRHEDWIKQIATKAGVSLTS